MRLDSKSLPLAIRKSGTWEITLPCKTVITSQRSRDTQLFAGESERENIHEVIQEIEFRETLLEIELPGKV